MDKGDSEHFQVAPRTRPRMGDRSFSIRNKSRATSIRVHQTSAVPVSSYDSMIADVEWKKSQAYMIQNRTSVR